MSKNIELNVFERKALIFATNLKNAYKGEEDSEWVGGIELKEEALTEDFTAMLYGVYVMYKNLTEDDVDFIGFTHLCNRLAIQHLMEPKGGSEEWT